MAEGNPFLAYAENNQILIHGSVKFGDKVILNIKGSGHQITIEEGVVLRNITINIIGEKNELKIGRNSNLRGVIHLRQPNSSLLIGQRVTAVTVHFFAMEGKTISIGDDSMFSSGIYIRTSDEHPIYDIETDARINEAKDVTVGSKVWLAEGVTLNKGTQIANGCIVGARSVVSGKLKRQSAVYAGVPAKLIREGIKWERKLP